jgi:mRNA interferase MazF
MADKRIRRGDIVWAELGQHPGKHIQSGRRPCLVVNTNRNNGPVYTVMPGTSKKEKEQFPVHVTVENKDVKGVLNTATFFMEEQLICIDQQQVILKAGHIINKEVMEKINAALIRQLELGDE